MMRDIVATVRRERSTLLKLSCGHDRSIGGHILNGQSVGAWKRYDCQDGTCIGPAK